MKLRNSIKFALKGLLCTVVIFFLGCAATPYQPAEGKFTGGYTDIKIGPNKYRISFKGNAYISGQKAYRYTLYRAAEISVDHACDWFKLINRDERTRRDYAGYAGYVEKPRRSIVIKIMSEKPSKNAYNAIDIMNSTKVKKAKSNSTSTLDQNQY